MKRKTAKNDSARLAGPAADSQRLDRWLWYTRFFKTRALASAAVAGGHVRRNGGRAKPGDPVRPGDRLEIVRQQERFEVEAGVLPQRRGPAGEAQSCYTETRASLQRRQELKERLKQDRASMPRTRGRPDKHTRRLLRERNRSGE